MNTLPCNSNHLKDSPYMFIRITSSHNYLSPCVLASTRGSTKLAYRTWPKHTRQSSIPGIPAVQELQLPPRLRWHLFIAKAELLGNIRAGSVPTVHGGYCMAIELDRSPDCTWGVPTRYDGCISTLRTKHRSTWVMLSANGGISRFLHPVEHLTLQGFPPEVSAHMSSEQMVHAAGNACSVPVMAAVILQVLCVCPQHSRPDGDAGDVVSADRSSQQADRSRQLYSAAKRRCLRDEIASLQAEVHALASERRCLEELSYLRSRPRTRQ